MFDLTRYPRLAKVFWLFDRAQALVFRGIAGGREADSHLGAFYAAVWREAASAVGATVEPLGHGAFEIRVGDLRTRVLRNSTAIDDVVTSTLVRTKPVVYGLLARHGLPVPRHVAFGIEDMRKAVAFMEETTRECVVKPASDTGGGAGVSTGIRTRWQLARAAFAAAYHSRDVVIEEQAEGDNYRLLYLDGKLLDAVLRKPPSVTGDGRSSIGQLVQQTNRARLRQGYGVSHDLLSVDLDMKRTLARQGLSLTSVPAAGAVIAVKTVINQNSSAENLTATHLVGPELLEEGARAAAIAGVRLAGVDVITPDPAVSLHRSGGVILEVNSPPGYYWHYHKRDGTFPLAVHVLRSLLQTPGPRWARPGGVGAC
jgi:D-alanine-D-alanine ligase-like ATP-grasp enzyme